MSAPEDQQQPQADTPRKPKAPSVRRACIACHTGKTRCSEALPCQSCVKRGLGPSCAYPDPDHPPPPAPVGTVDPTHTTYAPPPSYSTPTTTQYYQDYSGQYTGASSSTFRPTKRPRALTEDETNAITRPAVSPTTSPHISTTTSPAAGFQRGDFYVGTSAPVRIDPRLPVRLTLGDQDHVHFTVGEAML